MTPVLLEDQVFNEIPQNEGDTAVLSFGYQDRPIIVRRTTVSGADIQGHQAEWTLKHSKVFDALYEDCTFENGSERAFDQVRGGNIIFRRCKFINTKRKRTTSKWNLQKECDIGIKAGVFDITFEDCVFNDILIGDYSLYDQVNRPKSRRVTLRRCTNPNGGAIIVRVRYGTPVIADNTNVSQLVWPSFVTSIYWAYNRHFGDTRPIPPQEQGLCPEELAAAL